MTPKVLPIVALAGLLFTLLQAAPAAAQPLPDERALIDGFEKIAFGTEIAGFFGSGRYIRKFDGPVRFHIEDRATKPRALEVRRFVRSLAREIDGLRVGFARGTRDANFIVHVVDRADYQGIGRRIHGSPFMRVPGDCIVRAQYGPAGIVRSDALIVSDEGDGLFRRCLIEEVLQGLGPLDDNPDAPNSVFNDRSTVGVFTRYDKIMLNMLYDRRLKPGMDLAAARPLLPDLARSARRRVR
ncbi:hypothetical protein Sa4125_03210 [Aureimonas sp. SA4125]|uniref:DUF2927 domain-containing protein n=1 Tax=Aureimonas sp. SA4125 TaxID=2826993 RepID=UPI001CC390EE|nr:DUF2927 domain-containing protein [Aureimonas sp. SA4125]BDA82779.1 hypothetical protein Sa4125_03210 [Aureimonas sp. SA4125]